MICGFGMCFRWEAGRKTFRRKQVGAEERRSVFLDAIWGGDAKGRKSGEFWRRSGEF